MQRSEFREFWRSLREQATGNVYKKNSVMGRKQNEGVEDDDLGNVLEPQPTMPRGRNISHNDYFALSKPALELKKQLNWLSPKLPPDVQAEVMNVLKSLFYKILPAIRNDGGFFISQGNLPFGNS